MPAVVLIDTNVWVSALLNPTAYPARVVRAWLEDRFQVVISFPLLEELADVLARPRLIRKYGLTPGEVEELLRLIVRRARVVAPTGSLHECRDPDDDIVLETAVLGQARQVITRDDDIKGDQDLIERLRPHGVSIVSVQHFLDMLDASEV